MSSKLNDETLDFIYALTRDAPNILAKEIDELRTKLFQVFSVGSALIGLAGLSANQHAPSTAAAVVLGVALAFYVGATVVILAGSRTVSMRRTYYADEIWLSEWGTPVKDIKHSIVSDVVEAYKHNAKVITEKARYANAAILLTGLETLFIGASVLIGWV